MKPRTGAMGWHRPCAMIKSVADVDPERGRVSIAAVVVNFRTAEATIAAVGALLRDLESVPGSSVVIVDNDSGDGSLDRLRAAFPPTAPAGRVAVVDAAHNGGYGFGINVGVRHALAAPQPPRYIYILNPDATADPGSLAALLTFMDSHPDAGLAGSVIRGPGGEVQAHAFRFPSVWSQLEGSARLGPISRLLERHIVALTPSQTCEVDWVPGTSMLVRAEVFARGVWFDEGFFLYYEEIDFARQVKAAGWKVYYVADASITHIGGLATGMADESRPMPRYWFESRRRYHVKHHGRATAALGDAAWLAGHAIYRLRGAVQPGQSPTRPRLGRDLARFSLEQFLHPAPYAEQNRGHSSAAVGNGTPIARYPDGSPVMTDASSESTSPATAPAQSEQVPILELLAEDFATHERDLTTPGFWAIATHRIGARALDPSRPRAERAVLDVAYRALFTGVDWIWGIHLPRTVALGRRVRIWHNGAMLLTARSIGNDVTLRHDTTFGPLRTGRPVSETAAGAAAELPVIEDGADLGSGVCVLGGVRVGRGAVVGANSVVLKNVPPGATVLGVPARIVPM
jgi:N-acetylglucosaminyl-diphospho-decaprenol L-rhamnosyltransferase